MKPVYSDLIVAYGQGRVVQFQDCTLKDPTEWNDLSADNTEVWPSLLRTDGRESYLFKFRIKPRTVKIGSREVEAPVLEPVEGQTVWYWDSVHWKPVASGGRHEDWAQDGWYFASPEACRAAHEAWAALMRGEA